MQDLADVKSCIKSTDTWRSKNSCMQGPAPALIQLGQPTSSSAMPTSSGELGACYSARCQQYLRQQQYVHLLPTFPLPQLRHLTAE